MTHTVGIALALYEPDVATFREQLASIVAQTYSDWFCVVSADSPLARLSERPELAEFSSDPRFIWHQNTSALGIKGNFLCAMQLAADRGARFIACADQDDIWYPHKLATLVAAIADKPPLSLVHADMDALLDGVIQERSVWQIERRRTQNATSTSILVLNVATGASMLLDAELVRRFHDPADEVRWHDHWFAFLASLSGGVYPITERLHAYRQHGHNVIGLHTYRGLFDGLSPAAILAKRQEAVDNFRDRRALVAAAKRHGLPVTTFQKLAFERSFDGGLVLVAFGLASGLASAVARECLALAGGKLLAVLPSFSRAHSPSTSRSRRSP